MGRSQPISAPRPLVSGDPRYLVHDGIQKEGGEERTEKNKGSRQAVVKIEVAFYRGAYDGRGVVKRKAKDAEKDLASQAQHTSEDVRGDQVEAVRFSVRLGTQLILEGLLPPHLVAVAALQGLVTRGWPQLRSISDT